MPIFLQKEGTHKLVEKSLLPTISWLSGSTQFKPKVRFPKGRSATPSPRFSVVTCPLEKALYQSRDRCLQRHTNIQDTAQIFHKTSYGSLVLCLRVYRTSVLRPEGALPWGTEPALLRTTGGVSGPAHRCTAGHWAAKATGLVSSEDDL